MVKQFWKPLPTSQIHLLFWLFGIFLGIIQAFRYRYTLSSDDIVPYLDVADAYLRGDWKNAINGNWSPLYSWLLGLTFWLLKPSSAWEFPTVKLLNFLIYLFAFVSFEFFLRQFIQYIDKSSFLRTSKKTFKIPEWIWLCLGYTLFIFSSIYWIGVNCDTPDMVNAGFLYLASGLILRITMQPEHWLNFVALGAVLAFGYFSRAAMFPLACVFLLVTFFSGRNLRQALPRTFIALLIFLLITSPYIAALSLKKGHLTFSETGKLSYVWFVHPTFFVIPDHFWQGEPPEFGTPKNPLREVFSEPKVFEFAEPIGGTYPLWTDPSYWYEGIIAKFNIKALIRVLILNLLSYLQIFLGVVLFGYLMLFVWSGRIKEVFYNLASRWQLLVLAIAGLSLFSISTDFSANTMSSQPATRFIAVFIVLLFAGLYSSVQLPNLRSTKTVVTSLAIATMVIISIQLGVTAAKSTTEILFENQENIHWQVATGLKELGVQSGDKVAILGPEMEHVFWARLARVKVTVQLPEVEKFWLENEAVRIDALNAIKATDVDIVVTSNKPVGTASNIPWRQVSNTQYYAYFPKPI